jgi:hypothetical protein
MRTENEELIEYRKWKDIFTGWKVEVSDIVNFLIKKYDYKKYLEIGVMVSRNFNLINIESKESVDPYYPATHQVTSDDFFNSIDSSIKYDIIFIDGLHYSEQVYKDILNSLDHLNDNGIILCHDMNPPFEVLQRKESIVESWNGDCWKAFVKLRNERADLNMCVIDTDWGIGIIKRGSQSTIVIPEDIDYWYFTENRKELLNLIDVEEFYNKF